MSLKTEFKLMDINRLTITEQLLFALESIRDEKNPTILEAKKNYAVVGATIADLFNFKKASIIDNEIVLKDNEKTDYDYINDLIDKLDSLENNKLLMDVIFSYQNKGRCIENDVLDELVNKKLLFEQRTFLPIIGPKEIHESETAFSNRIKYQVENALSKTSKPEKKFIYVLAILDAIDLLPYFVESTIEM